MRFTAHHSGLLREEENLNRISNRLFDRGIYITGVGVLEGNGVGQGD